MIIDTSTITSKVLKDLMEWETQLMKQRKYINDKLDEVRALFIDKDNTSSEVLLKLLEWEAQLLKQRHYIDEKINEIERVIKENYGGGDGKFYHPDTHFLQNKDEREVK